MKTWCLFAHFFLQIEQAREEGKAQKAIRKRNPIRNLTLWDPEKSSSWVDSHCRTKTLRHRRNEPKAVSKYFKNRPHVLRILENILFSRINFRRLAPHALGSQGRTHRMRPGCGWFRYGLSQGLGSAQSDISTGTST